MFNFYFIKYSYEMMYYHLHTLHHIIISNLALKNLTFK